MGIFTRKSMSDKVPEIVPPKHQHVWKDMPWYMHTSYDGGKRTADYDIIEPYICITCGERKNVTLEHGDWGNITSEERDKRYNKIRNKYKRYLKPQAVVEDMINNILLVRDPEHLRMIEEMLGSPHSGVGTSAQMPDLFKTEQEKKAPRIETE